MIYLKPKHHFKDHFSETRLFLNRTIWSLLVMLLLISIALSRLFYLQVNNHSHYITLSHDNRVKIVPVPPTRGLIYDRNGVLLAEIARHIDWKLFPNRSMIWIHYSHN